MIETCVLLRSCVLPDEEALIQRATSCSTDEVSLSCECRTPAMTVQYNEKAKHTTTFADQLPARQVRSRAQSASELSFIVYANPNRTIPLNQSIQLSTPYAHPIHICTARRRAVITSSHTKKSASDTTVWRPFQKETLISLLPL